MNGLTKMRAQDLLNILMDYCLSPEEDDREAWLAWNAAWEQADESLRRDALMIAGTRLAEVRRKVAGVTT